MVNFSLWALLPPIYSVCTAAGLWAVYGIGVHKGYITALSSQYRRNDSYDPPYISIAGNFPPASCIFSEVMNLAAFVGFIIGVLRYLQVKNKIDKPWLNIVSLVCFSIGCFGATIVGNFQVFTEEDVHNVSIIVGSIVMMLFCWMQSYITLRVNLKNEGRKAAIARFLLSGSITLCMILFFPLRFQHFQMQASQCEWAVAMFFLIFIATFAIEFRHSSFWMECRDTSE